MKATPGWSRRARVPKRNDAGSSFSVASRTFRRRSYSTVYAWSAMSVVTDTTFAAGRSEKGARRSGHIPPRARTHGVVAVWVRPVQPRHVPRHRQGDDRRGDHGVAADRQPGHAESG